MEHAVSRARKVIEQCQSIAGCTTEPGFTTRSFLSEPMRGVHAQLSHWMKDFGMKVSIDAAGNLRGLYPAGDASARRLYIGSHLDTVPRAGAYDGVLGVVIGVALIEALAGRRLGFDIEVIGFSEEEGLRFGIPFIGSRALVGDVDDELLDKADSDGVRVRDSIRNFGLDPAQIPDARAVSDALGYFEIHIEQGPVLENLGLPLGVVEAIAGQSRLQISFKGQTNHAGTTPMGLRRDALAGAAEWVASVEKEAHSIKGLVATVGRLDVEPGASNIVPGLVRATLDVRHAADSERKRALQQLLRTAEAIGERRGLSVSSSQQLDQSAVAMDAVLTLSVQRAVGRAGFPVQRMISGAGHDAMIVARCMPAAMLFLRSPAGISHDSGESVLEEDVRAALMAGSCFLEEIESKQHE
jgi:allantoate deiminase